MKIYFQGNIKILLLSLSGFFVVALSFLIHYFDPKVWIGRTAAVISPWSITYKMFQSPPYDIMVKMYIFNVTNGEDFISGKDQKLKFEEIGPYTYKEHLFNTEMTFNDNGTLSYVPRRHLEFIPDQSVGDPKTDVFLIPNVPLLGIASMLHQSSMFLNLAVASLTRYLKSEPILNITAHDYFWGYEDSLVEAANKILPNWINFKRFGILDRMYDEGNDTVNMVVDPYSKEGSSLLPEEERGRLYSIKKWNGSPGLEQWGYKMPQGNETPESNSRCNMLEGAYEGSIFPVNLKKEWTFRIYRKFVCRPVPIRYNRTGYTKDGYEGYYYNPSPNFLDKYEDNPENECYCKDKNFCLPKGLGDITPCYYGFPTAVSQPHFLNADPVVFDKIEGLQADPVKHESQVIVNPDVGLLLEAYSRMQTNLVMRQTKYISKAAPFNNMIIPLFWSEMSVDHLPDSINVLMFLLFKVLPPVQCILMYALGLIGGGLIATAGYKVLFTDFSDGPRSRQDSQCLGIPLGITYSPVRIIPVIRRQSLISEFRDRGDITEKERMLP